MPLFHDQDDNRKYASTNPTLAGLICVSVASSAGGRSVCLSVERAEEFAIEILDSLRQARENRAIYALRDCLAGADGLEEARAAAQAFLDDTEKAS